MENIDELDSLIMELTEIFKDELLLEPTIIYADLLRDGCGNPGLVKGILYNYNDLLEDYEHYGHYAYVALALFQFNLGRLDKYVKVNALKVIDKDIILYEKLENPLLTLEQLCDFKYKLEGILPLKVKIKRKPYYKCEWKLGDVFAYQITDEKTPQFNPRRDSYPFDDYLKKYNMMNKYVMLMKVGEMGEKRNLAQIVSFFNWYGDEPITDIEKIKQIDILPSNVKRTVTSYNNMYVDNKEEYDKANLIYMGNIVGLEVKNFYDFSKYPSMCIVRMDNINAFINSVILKYHNEDFYRHKLLIEKDKIVSYRFKE